MNCLPKGCVDRYRKWKTLARVQIASLDLPTTVQLALLSGPVPFNLTPHEATVLN
jgi:hypothetical protein